VRTEFPNSELATIAQKKASAIDFLKNKDKLDPDKTARIDRLLNDCCGILFESICSS
jgi:hypothetical protein